MEFFIDVVTAPLHRVLPSLISRLTVSLSEISILVVSKASGAMPVLGSIQLRTAFRIYSTLLLRVVLAISTKPLASDFYTMLTFICMCMLTRRSGQLATLECTAKLCLLGQLV